MRMAVCQTLKNLVGERLDFTHVEGFVSIFLCFLFHVFLDVVFTVFEDQMEFFVFINDFFELYNVGMFKTFEKGNLSDGR